MASPINNGLRLSFAPDVEALIKRKHELADRLEAVVESAHRGGLISLPAFVLSRKNVEPKDFKSYAGDATCSCRTIYGTRCKFRPYLEWRKTGYRAVRFCGLHMRIWLRLRAGLSPWQYERKVNPLPLIKVPKAVTRAWAKAA